MEAVDGTDGQVWRGKPTGEAGQAASVTASTRLSPPLHTPVLTPRAAASQLLYPASQLKACEPTSSEHI